MTIRVERPMEAKMTIQTNKPAKKQDEGMGIPFADAAKLGGCMFQAYLQATQELLENAVAFNQELTRFAGERFRADMQAFQAFAQCANWSGLAAFQSDFAQTAVKAYQNEFSKLMERNSAAMTGTCKPILDAAKDFTKAAAE